METIHEHSLPAHTELFAKPLAGRRSETGTASPLRKVVPVSELYHVFHLSQKCPEFPAGLPESPVNTRGSGKKENIAVADEKNFYHIYLFSFVY
ncbi:MAG: hypothetical protein Q4D81_12020 [Eubacteriales bacterium]|nr:hypothetical protein [Eubacteriales bacterium]